MKWDSLPSTPKQPLRMGIFVGNNIRRTTQMISIDVKCITLISCWPPLHTSRLRHESTSFRPPTFSKTQNFLGKDLLSWEFTRFPDGFTGFTQKIINRSTQYSSLSVDSSGESHIPEQLPTKGIHQLLTHLTRGRMKRSEGYM